MTKYREILRLASLGLSQQSIADSSGVSKKTVNRVLKRAKELNIFWPLEANETDAVLAEKLFPSAQKQVSSTKRMPDFNYIQKELLRNGVNKKLLWTEYLEECRQSGDDPLMYSQFCYYIQQDEQKRRATMHINRKPGEQIEVDWTGDPAQITDPDTGEIIPAFLFVGVMTYSLYPYKTTYVRLPDMLLELDLARTDGTYKKVLAKYANPVLLIIDEWLLLKPTEAEQHDIMELLHRRRKRSSTIFCSQYDPSGWYDQLGGDDSPLAEAILDRIKHDAYKINIVPTDPANYRSMREVYGLDPALSE